MFDTLQPSFRLILGAVVSLLLWQGHSPGYGQEAQESVAEQPQAEPEPNQEPAQEPAAELPPEPLEFEPPAPEAEPAEPEPAQEPAAEHLPEPPASEPPAEQPPEPLEFEPPEQAEPAESESEQTAEPPPASEPAQEPAAEQPPEPPEFEHTAEPAAEPSPEPLEFEPPESEPAQEPAAEQSPEPPAFEHTAEPPPEPPASEPLAEPPPEPLEFEPTEPEAEPAESELEHTAEPPPDQAEAASEAEQVVTRAWVHDDFGRIVFDWPGDVGYTASIADKTLTVVFDHRLETTFEQVWSHLGAYITDIALGPDGRTVMAALTDDYRLRTFPLHQGEITKIVLDVLAGPEPDQPTAAQAEAQLASAAAEPPPDAQPADHPLSDPLPEEEGEQPAAPTAAAQPPPDPSPAHTTAAAAEQPPEPPLLTLSLGHSRIIRLETPAASVFIGNPALADVNLVSSSVLHLLGKAIGRTSLAALDQAGALIAEWTVATVVDVGPVRSALEGAPALKDMGVRHLNKGVELSGVVASAAQADLAMRLAVAALPEEVPVTNHIRVAGAQQVNLEVQIAEMQRSVSESLGINWEAVDANGTRIAGFRIGRDFINETTNQFIRAILPGGTAAAAVGQQLIGTTQVRVLLDALATAGLVSVLARPSLTAVSGETASFFSGGEFPLPAGFDDGVIAFSYKKFGVLLDFVPTVVDSGRIVLTVRSEVSQRSATDSITVTGLDIPVIDGRRAETTVEVGNGESIVIAGLYRDQSETTESGMPFLKDIPLVNLLFSSRTARSNATELIVVVTARLTDATSIPLAENREQPSAGRRLRGYYY